MSFVILSGVEAEDLFFRRGPIRSAAEGPRYLPGNGRREADSPFQKAIAPLVEAFRVERHVPGAITKVLRLGSAKNYRQNLRSARLAQDDGAFLREFRSGL
jgi:hypothetical protein